MIVLQPVGTNFHERPIHAAAPRAAVEPYYCPLSVRDVLVLEVPEEQIPVIRSVDFDVSEFVRLACSGGEGGWGGVGFDADAERKGNTHPACIFTSDPGGCPGRDLTKYWAALMDGASVTAACAIAKSDNDNDTPSRDDDDDDAARRILMLVALNKG